MVDLIETKILSHHMPLYLNVYGQAHQMSQMAPAAPEPLPFYKGGSHPKNILNIIRPSTSIYMGRLSKNVKVTPL